MQEFPGSNPTDFFVFLCVPFYFIEFRVQTTVEPRFSSNPFLVGKAMIKSSSFCETTYEIGTKSRFDSTPYEPKTFWKTVEISVSNPPPPLL